MYIIESIGDYAVEITQFVSVVCLLYVNPYLIIAYIIGFFVNTWVNGTLKKWLGGSMPSCHLQKMAYSIAFVVFTLVNKNALSLYWKYIGAVYGVAVASCLYNCIMYEYHTISEMIVGSGIGAIMGYGAHLISRKVIDK
jgi:hypothetical protein